MTASPKPQGAAAAIITRNVSPALPTPPLNMISIVIPVFNEEESLAILYDEIAAGLRPTETGYEVLFVDDGSRDRSWEVIRDLADKHFQVRGLRFRRNFGKAAALSAGFAAATGDTVLTLDADLQDDPAEIPNFMQAMAHGHDVVSGWKKTRHDPWHKVWPSRVFNFFVSWLTGVKLHDHNCGMKCYRSEIFHEIRLYGELHRFIPVLAAARGFRVGELAIKHRPRRFGHSKYGVRRFVKGFLDLLTVKFLTGFSQRPQHVLGTAGLFSFVLGAAGLGWLLVTWFLRLWWPDDYLAIHERALPVFALAALMIGTQLMSIGFLAELVIAYQSGDQLPYSIAETTPEKTPSPVA
jgi:glycosyltransferase involved in cell wall biosynthesis